ncbi:unnamed protein product [Hyaloperonospora brassicae]|uniref:Transcription factor CBF/NF-Y/archaeal histone domain-containing protein n=1 Tax=Hyaloperonospora brassicae TaxID=162125 RepID=A0AAV0URM2_HYABA|nr:unnamed protein product [Hyaloperonospora brassicae]
MKQRNVLKGRVKRLLKEQKDMGQVGESAVVGCVSAVELFVRDLAGKMRLQAAEGHALTPIELKKSVLSSGELSFLHEKVTAIDESAVRYPTSARRGGKKRTSTTAATKSSSKKAKTTTTAAKKTVRTSAKTAARTVETATAKTSGERSRCSSKEAVPTEDSVSCGHRVQPLAVEEDEDYDESDSDE